MLWVFFIGVISSFLVHPYDCLFKHIISWYGVFIGTEAHEDVIKWKHFPRYWPLVPGIHWWLVNSPHKGQGCRALMFSLICAWTNSWTNNGDAGDLWCHHAHYDIIVMNHVIDPVAIKPPWTRCIKVLLTYHNNTPAMSIYLGCSVFVDE